MSHRVHIMMQYWQDDFFTWDPSDYGGLDNLHMRAEKIWLPDITLYEE